MKKIVILALCFAMSALCLCGCVSVNFMGFDTVTGVGEPERYEFKVGEFSEIRVELFCDVEYYRAPSNVVTLEIQPNLVDYVTVTESGGVLTVRGTQGINWTGRAAPMLTVSTPVLNSMLLMGAGSFTAHDKITADSLSLSLSGAGKGAAELDVDDLTVDISGAGSFNLSGRADTARLLLAGAGSVEALSLQTRDADINLAGAGSVRVACSDNLSVSAGGVGSVEYTGNPSIDLSRGGLVSVEKVG